jgi:hypothetical protein
MRSAVGHVLSYGLQDVYMAYNRTFVTVRHLTSHNAVATTASKLVTLLSRNPERGVKHDVCL